MSKTVSLSIDGLAALNETLSNLPQATQKNALVRVLKAAGVPVDEAWRARVHRVTGRLEESGGVSTTLSPHQRREQAADGKSFAQVYVGPGPDPAAVQDEFGNSHQAPQGFMRAAWDETQDQALQIVQAQLGDEINKAALRYAKKLAKARSAGS